MPDRLVLALDGSTRVCGAALLRPVSVSGRGEPGNPAWEVVARRAVGDGRAQARALLALVDDMLRDVEKGPEELGAIVVGTGPGTFTGVRIAVATGRALSLALGVPVLGVSTLAALAASAALREGDQAPSAEGAAAGPGAEAAGVLVPVVDARRGQIFYGVYVAAPVAGGSAAPWVDKGLTYEAGRGQRYCRSEPYGVAERDALGTVLEGMGSAAADRVMVVGEDRELVRDLPAGARFIPQAVQPEMLVMGQELLEEPGPDPQGPRLTPWLLRALEEGWSGGLGSPALDAVCPGGSGTPESVTPVYVRSPDADIHILKMRDPFAGDAAEHGAGGPE